MGTDRPQTATEELVNAVTHGVGALLGVGGLVATLAFAGSERGDALSVGALVAYTLSVVALFGVSSAYHAVRSARWKGVLQKADHCAIYLLIAGTYTPLALVGLGGGWGRFLFVSVWSLAVAGIGLELAVTERWHRTSLALYLGMGWLAVIAAVPLVNALPLAATALVLVGGLLYTGGTWFYSRDRHWDHAVWHGFVLGGAVTHGAAVALCVA
ncbi:MAG: hemolysin III family protein [Myxococcota bacterium]